MLLVDHVRKELGLSMQGIHFGSNIGWTSDREKAEQAKAAGCQAIPVSDALGATQGFEIVIPIGKKM